MDQQSVIADFEERARRADVSMRQVCMKAGVAASTFSRWKVSEGNPNPVGATLASIGRLDEALRSFETQQAAA